MSDAGRHLVKHLNYKLMATRFFLCTVCGNVIVKVADSGVDPVCCGQEMKELVPGSMDGAKEKHVPVVEHKGSHVIVVKVGSEPHPMTNLHFISFICLETRHGFQVRYLHSGQDPEAYFICCNDRPVAVYAYCNIHGLWKTEINECLMKMPCGPEDDKKRP